MSVKKVTLLNKNYKEQHKAAKKAEMMQQLDDRKCFI